MWGFILVAFLVGIAVRGWGDLIEHRRRAREEAAWGRIFDDGRNQRPWLH